MWCALPIRRMDITSNLISVEAVAAGGLFHLCGA